MSKQWTHTEAFAHFGAKGANQRWSWSARSPDGKTVVITLWQHQLKVENKKAIYRAEKRESVENWENRNGNQERLENLKWAMKNCDGLFHVVIAIAEDVNAHPHRIKECFPKPNMMMRIIELNEETGEFQAESVDLKAV